jgi:predicted MPP superfamily phosphohydrolase
MVLAIMGGMLAMDVACCVLSLKLIRRRFWKGFSLLFVGSQVVGFLALTAGRFGYLSRALPKPVVAAVYIWHFLGLGIVLAIGAGAFPVLAFKKFLGRVSSPLPESAPGERLSGSEADLGDGVTRRQFLGVAAAIAPPLFTVSLTSLGLAQLRGFRLRRYELPVPGLPKALEGMTIAQVSDIHIGRFTSGQVLAKIVETTNALRSDLVLLTGDLIDFALADLGTGIDLVRKLQGRHGLFMIEGNHDLIENGREFERRVRQAGIPLLLNESAIVDVRGYPVELLGVRWEHAPKPLREERIAGAVRKVLQGRQPDAFPILLSHHPHSFDAAAEAGLPLTLSGHTHGGQLMLTEQLGFGPAMFRYWSGLYSKGNSRLIVSNGVGNWFPVRINAPAEIVHVTLRNGQFRI